METWNLKVKGVPHTLTYEDETHTYKVDGTKVPSVTQVLHYNNPNKYADVDPAVLKKAAERGTAMHQAIEDYEVVGIENAEVEELEGYKILKAIYKWDFLEAEQPILIEYKGHFIAGRYDQLIKLEGTITLNDFKRYASMDKKTKQDVAMQLNLYRIGLKQTYNIDVEKIRCTRLRKDIREFIEMPIVETLAYQLLDEYMEAKYESKNI